MANPGVRFNFSDARRIRRFVERLDPRDRSSVVHQVMVDTGKLTKADARENRIVRGRGKTSKPLSDRLTWRTGNLTRSISTDNTQAPRRYIVGTPANYSVVHELGLSPFPKRQFLTPAAEKVIRQDVPQLFRLALQRAGTSG